MRYLDPLYGQLEMSDKQLKLFQTNALTRIRDISLSVVPPMATPSGMITSRFEHSVGVSHLVRELSKIANLDHLGENLYIAGLYHDAGSPPFSHASELFLEDMTGKNHEEFVENILNEDDSKKAIKAMDGDIEIIYHLITGNLQPWSDLINGTIDLDNIDNSLRWGMGIGIFQNKFYEPEEIIKAYIIGDDYIGIRQDHYADIQKWELCRRLVYDVVYSDLNQAPGSVLFRALEFAYKEGDLDLSFFSLTESQALYVLENRCNPRTKKLMFDLRNWNFFHRAGEITQINNASTKLKGFCTNWKQRQKVADIVASNLKIAKEDVAIQAGMDKGFKKIHLPFFKDGKQVEEHQPIQKKSWRMIVYIDPKHKNRSKEVQEILESVVE